MKMSFNTVTFEISFCVLVQQNLPVVAGVWAEMGRCFAQAQTDNKINVFHYYLSLSTYVMEE